jgi:hypothetical protein
MANAVLRLQKLTVECRLITEECPTCGILFAWPEDFHRNVRQAGKARCWYCPVGHVIQWDTSEADEIRRERDRLKQQLAQKDDTIRDWIATANNQRDRANRERNRANGYKGHATRITKRAKAGICPCCNRHFTQLERHMTSKHPDFTPIEIEKGEPS